MCLVHLEIFYALPSEISRRWQTDAKSREAWSKSAPVQQAGNPFVIRNYETILFKKMLTLNWRKIVSRNVSAAEESSGAGDCGSYQTAEAPLSSGGYQV